MRIGNGRVCSVDAASLVKGGTASVVQAGPVSERQGVGLFAQVDGRQAPATGAAIDHWEQLASMGLQLRQQDLVGWRVVVMDVQAPVLNPQLSSSQGELMQEVERSMWSGWSG
jgi:hypothetical protein